MSETRVSVSGRGVPSAIVMVRVPPSNRRLSSRNARSGASATNGLAPLSLAFDASGSTDADGKVVRWEWYFGDGATALGRTTSKTFTTGGTFPVTLLTRDTQGGVSTASRMVTVAALRILNANVSGPDFTLNFPTATNRTYVIERTTSLSPAAWTELTTLPGNGSVRSVTHTNAGGAQQFYRLRAD